jgi:hypothetical protein
MTDIEKEKLKQFKSEYDGIPSVGMRMEGVYLDFLARVLIAIYEKLIDTSKVKDSEGGKE